MDHPLFAIVTTTAGAVSILHRPTGEIMHNPVGPWIEANHLYIDQSNLRERWNNPDEKELVVFDVGLGAAANALAALHCIENATAENPALAEKTFHLVSFEKEIELLHYALLHSEKFSHFAGYEEAIRELIEKKIWERVHIRWELREGDFRECIAAEPTKAHLIFYDPYSPKMNPEMWSAETFKKLHARSRTQAEGGTSLFTYSQATPIRVALLQAGFFVGEGTGTGLKKETTVASTVLSSLNASLSDRWYKRWSTSQTPYPLLADPKDYEAISAFVKNHPQFRNRARAIIAPIASLK